MPFSVTARVPAVEVCTLATLDTDALDPVERVAVLHEARAAGRRTVLALARRSEPIRRGQPRDFLAALEADADDVTFAIWQAGLLHGVLTDHGSVRAFLAGWEEASAEIALARSLDVESPPATPSARRWRVRRV